MYHEAEPLLHTNVPAGDGLRDVDELELEVGEDAAQAEKALVRKVDRRMSILILIYILNYMDRNNAAAARLRGFEEDLGMEGTQFATVLSVLYIGYIAMQIPSNMLLNYYQKPSKYLTTCMILWGLLSVQTGWITSYNGVLATRFLLGFVEAAFFPGALLLISKWYTRHELSERTALLSSGILLSNAFGSLIASAILDVMDGVLGYAAWRWLFFVEGTLTVIVAIWAIYVLPDFPESTTGWLTDKERSLAIRRMQRDSQATRDQGKNVTQWDGFWLAIKDWKVWYLAIALLLMVTSLSFGVYLPTISATMGYSTTFTLLLCAPPWLFGTLVSLFVSRQSDRMGERCKFIAASLFVGIIGFYIAYSTMNTALRYISMFLMAQMYAGFICFLAWASGSVAHPPEKRAVALALINCVSQMGNVFGAYAWPSSWGPSYAMSFLICIALAALSMAMCVGFRLALESINAQADKAEAAAGEPKGFRYML